MLENFIRPDHVEWDTATWNEVTVQDCYSISKRSFNAESVVIDVGANIGFFSGIVLNAGAGMVIAVEASVINFHGLTHNLYPFRDRCSLHNRAVWRSDDREPELRYLHEFPPDGNSGGVSILPNSGTTAVVTIGLDELISDHNVELLKMDCEGSEYTIVYTSKLLDQVREIIIETHPVDGSDAADIRLRPCDETRSGWLNNHIGLEDYLGSIGFETTLTPRKGMIDGWAYLRGIRP